ncbi:MAG: hypothetical protein R2813_09590 [Flavobacteriales bacterium]
MKRLHIIAIAMGMVSCSKEANILIEETSNTKQLSTTESFEVGVIDGDGSATITYNMQNLEEIAACAVFEEDAQNLRLSNEGNGNYFLRGIAKTQNSSTTFGVHLALENSVLYWQNNASIFTCHSEDGTACDLNIIDDEDYTCNSQQPSCNDQTIGDGGISYANCTNWPWATTKEDKK